MKKIFFVFFLLPLVYTTLPRLHAQVSQAEFDALLAIYQSAGGEDWVWGNQDDAWDFDAGPGDVINWEGVTVENDQVRELILRNKNLTGSLPAEIGDLLHLRVLRLSNVAGEPNPNQVGGQLPAQLENLQSLEWLDLGRNIIEGQIPTQLGQMVSLRILDLSRNNLGGEIPPSLGDLFLLERLILELNVLEGELPASLANLGSLEHIILNNNNLSGTISLLTDLPGLRRINLYGNQFSGTIPQALGDLNQLVLLEIGGNMLTGSIPVSLYDLQDLEQLSLRFNQLSGSIPPGISQLGNLQVLRLNNNQLDGHVPAEIGLLPELTGLHLGFNMLEGQLPQELGQLSKLQILRVNNNNLEGHVPAEITDLPDLEFLHLEHNAFSFLPPISTSSLRLLHVQFNSLQFDSIEPNLDAASEEFNYSPQARVGEEIQLEGSFGDSISMEVEVGGQHNTYQWRKDGSDIVGAVSSTFTIDFLEAGDAGIYHCLISNDLATQLTLRSEDITLNYAGSILPTVETDAAFDISPVNAMGGGEVISDGGGTLVARGLVWSRQELPDVDENEGIATDANNVVGPFELMMTGLEPATTYFFRAFATNEEGTAHGEILSFETTPVHPPTVETSQVTDITQGTATSGGLVIDDGDAAITARGVVWASFSEPDLSNNEGMTEDGSGTGSFTSQLTELSPGQNYHVRAYASNEFFTAYGQERSFRTLGEMRIPNAFMPESTILDNQYFMPIFDTPPVEYSMEIFNRWGGKVFETDSFFLGWDGRVNGSASPAGGYVYRIRYADQSGQEYEYNGIVMLVR